MKKYILYLLIILTSILTASCDSTSVLVVDVRHPAYVKFPNDIVNMAIVDNAGARLNDSIAKAQNVDEILILNSKGKSILTESLAQFLNEENFFTEVKEYPTPIRLDTVYGTMSPLLPSEVQRISQEADVDGIVSLDLVSIQPTDISMIVDGSRMRAIMSKITILFRVYDAEGKRLAPAMMSQDSVMAIISTKDNIYDIENHKDLILTMSEGMVRQIVPYWEKQERVVYSDATKLMKEAHKLASAGNWAEAAKIWGNAFESTNVSDKYKARIASNIALANENLDDIKNALIWINTATDLTASNKNSEEATYIKWYKIKLTEREKELSKLLEQLAISPD